MKNKENIKEAKMKEVKYNFAFKRHIIIEIILNGIGIVIILHF